jgi:hypothetical protein
MITTRGDASFPGVAHSLPRVRSWRLGHPTRSPETRIAHDHRSPPDRLWKCRRDGNHRTVSTAPWKSRTAREIPTFPQPVTFWGPEEEEQEEARAVSRTITRHSTPD